MKNSTLGMRLRKAERKVESECSCEGGRLHYGSFLYSSSFGLCLESEREREGEREFTGSSTNKKKWREDHKLAIYTTECHWLNISFFLPNRVSCFLLLVVLLSSSYSCLRASLNMFLCGVRICHTLLISPALPLKKKKKKSVHYEVVIPDLTR